MKKVRPWCGHGLRMAKEQNRTRTLNQIVRHFGTNHELNSGKGTINCYFRFIVGYHSAPLLGLD